MNFHMAWAELGAICGFGLALMIALFLIETYYAYKEWKESKKDDRT